MVKSWQFNLFDAEGALTGGGNQKFPCWSFYNNYVVCSICIKIQCKQTVIRNHNNVFSPILLRDFNRENSPIQLNSLSLNSLCGRLAAGVIIQTPGSSNPQDNAIVNVSSITFLIAVYQLWILLYSCLDWVSISFEPLILYFKSLVKVYWHEDKSKPRRILVSIHYNAILCHRFVNGSLVCSITIYFNMDFPQPENFKRL